MNVFLKDTYIILFQKGKCTLTISASRWNGYKADVDYHVTLMVEDYPDYTIKVGTTIRSIRRPISKIPLQVLFFIQYYINFYLVKYIMFRCQMD